MNAVLRSMNTIVRIRWRGGEWVVWGWWHVWRIRRAIRDYKAGRLTL